ncbi:MAG: DNA-directed RNA polymerase subunit beta' [Elusimicrobia bacterium RIFOXYB2_FULL_49_7]|nr:MAG: DNA-directed RNA polymerase subunit beta' [Elusimicrobia bacterium RIFOXYB2_FULL_49_7]
MTENKENIPETLSRISIRIASPEVIRGWSFGEVTKPETINYRSYKPEKDGLFCERIFGPVKNWECSCGKYKRVRYRGVVCDRCGVEVTHSRVRRERMGHIELAVPVAHIWFFRSMPSKIGYVLGMSTLSLERVIYYENYIVLEAGDSGKAYKELLSEDEYSELVESGKSFRAEMGAAAIREILLAVDLATLATDLREVVKRDKSEQRRLEAMKRLKIVEAFRKSGNKPEWMVLDVLPVIPPDLRPLVPLEGGRFATSDLNDLYRRVVNRNNRLKKLIEVEAPEVILRNEKRMLQEAIDALFDNGRRTYTLRGEGKAPLKSLSELLKGKQGRFRQNLLGKRVDYSGRSVIVVGPELQIHQCGLPKNMALELYKPFIIRKLEEKGYVQTIKSAKKFVEKERPEVWDILEEIIEDHPVFLNRAPTLHRLGIQAFYPVLIEGKAIRLHPFVCAAFNADFDGDQMAVHLPLSPEAQLEARVIMLSSHNILHPATGRPLAEPSQDVVIGCYYLTKERPIVKKRDNLPATIFRNVEEIVLALEHKAIVLHEFIKLEYNGQVIKTTPGRAIFNDTLPDELRFVNETMNKGRLRNVISRYHDLAGKSRTCKFLDKLKALGFEYATRAGVTVSIDDLIIPEEKPKMIAKAAKEVEEVNRQYLKNVITDGERYNKIIDIWTHTTNDVAEVLFSRMSEDCEGFNPVFMMADSGARGSKDQVKQLAGMRGLMAKPQKKITGQVGEIIENPITSNFKEGLTVLEYFISTHGARKGLADTALKTADAGYLTRRLVDVAQDLIITEEDCGTVRGVEVEPLKEGEEIVESLSSRIVGRFLQMDVYHPVSDKLIAGVGDYITKEIAEAIEDAGIELVATRSVLTCESERGVCVKCYGKNLALGKITDLGEAVGVMAAQSIGEPGTQLTLRTFHIGGTSGRIASQSKMLMKKTGKIRFQDVKFVVNNSEKVVIGRHGEFYAEDENGRFLNHYTVPYGAKLRIEDGELIQKDRILFEWDPYNLLILADIEGIVKYSGIKEKETIREEFDENSGKKNLVIMEHRNKKIHPHIHLLDKNDNKLSNISLPTGAYLIAEDGQKANPGDILVKIPRESSKTRDITGGLPRVSELFEARRPKDPAVVSEIEGVVSFGDDERGQRKLIVTADTGDNREYLLPHGKHLRVHVGDHVFAGERLCEGPIDPHDILSINGEAAVQKYLVNEIQEVYRLQGVNINDKHIGCIVRQMLRKVRISQSGDSDFIEGESVSRTEVRRVNRGLVESGKTPAQYEPQLLGITKASLATDSFISAASFQETTRVLSDASVSGKVDRLVGLKENVIMGNLIPCGTGAKEYRKLRIKDLDAEIRLDAELKSEDILEKIPQEGEVGEEIIF